jgi:hypothetical protein
MLPYHAHAVSNAVENEVAGKSPCTWLFVLGTNTPGKEEFPAAEFEKD